MIAPYVKALLSAFSESIRDPHRYIRSESFGDDRDRADILHGLDRKAAHERRSLFHRWSLDDMVAFVVKSYPNDLLVETAYRAHRSQFLVLLYDLWRPDVVDWIILLRRVCSLGSFRVFTLVLRLNHFHENKRMRLLGSAILDRLPNMTIEDVLPRTYFPITDQELRRLPVPEPKEEGDRQVVVPFGDDLLETLVASFVERPHDISCGRQHCRCILLLSESPRGVGTLCRRLFLFLQREDVCCRCDFYGPPEHDRRDRRGGGGPSDGGGGDPSRAPMCRCTRNGQFDSDKEYARSLMFCILETCHREEKLWTERDCQDFLLEACTHTFSKRIYEELATGLLDGGSEPLEIKNPRHYTKVELTENFHTDQSQVAHAGCAQMNCKQNFSRDCENVMCGQHCCRVGTNPCHIQKHNQSESGGSVPTRLKCLCCRYGTETEKWTGRRTERR